MPTKLRLKSRSKYKNETLRNLSLRHSHLEDCCKKQRETRARRRESLNKRRKISLTKVADKNVIDVIKSLSGSSDSTCSSCLAVDTSDCKIPRKSSDSSVIYVGTAYIKAEMPRKDSIIDLTKSDTTVLSSWTSNYNLDNYDISGDNIIDELHLKDHVSSAASIFTIFPPQPRNLFSSPSDELCVCQSDRPYCVLPGKRNLSTSDVSCQSATSKAKRVASSKSKISERMSADSSDCVWKLKKSYPLNNCLCVKGDDGSKEVMENMDVDLNYDVNILDIVEDLEKEFNISNSQHSNLVEEIDSLKVASVLDSNMSNV